MTKLYYAATGAGGSFLGMITGVIDIHGLLSAFVFGAVGALGGVVVKLFVSWLKKKLKKQ